jgi:hypothetical protein
MSLSKICHLLLVILAISLGFLRPGGAAQPNEYQVKAVFVLNFCKLSEWPRDAIAEKGTFPIAIIGRVSSTAFENTLRGQTVHGAHVTVRHIDEPEEAAGCRLVFITASERHRLSGILRELRQFNVLTVSDMEDFCDAGGMIALLTGMNKIKFEVNLAAVRKVRINVSSRLLALAEHVYGN